MKPPFKEGDRAVLTPARIGKRGEAVGMHQGWRVRVAGGLPDETARVRITHVSRGGPVAAAVFEEPDGMPHPARRKPPCPIHDTCGGCGLQHATEDRVLAWKIEQARGLMPDADWLEPIVSPRAFAYRAKTFLLPQWRGSHLLLGARPPRGPRLVDTSGCGVLRPEIETLAARLRSQLGAREDLVGRLHALLLRSNRKGQTQLTVVHRGPPSEVADVAAAAGADAAFLQSHAGADNVICSQDEEIRVAGDTLEERFGDAIDVAIPATAFMQANPDVAEALYVEAAVALEGNRLAELYCGGGIAGLLALSRGDAQLHGVDRSPRAIAAAQWNAMRNGLGHRCMFEAIAAEDASGAWDSVLVNPPRAGCDASVLEAIAKSEARRCVYLSCNPATLARDVEALGWTLESVRPADMLPQTPHLELLAILSRPGPSRD